MPFTEDEWKTGQRWESYLAEVESHTDIWQSHWKQAQVDETTRKRLEDLPGPRKVLVLSADWCGDAARSVPVIAKACLASPKIELRLVGLADHEDMMLRHLTKGARAIPVAVVEDEDGRDLGWWGPRPAPLQAILRERLIEKGRPDRSALGEWYAPIMAWYKKDGGRTTLSEFTLLLERGGEPR